MRVRLRVQPGDYGDIEFESFSGMIAALDGMSKSLHNTEWLATPLSHGDIEVADGAIGNLKAIFAVHREDKGDAGREWDAATQETEIQLSYRPSVVQENLRRAATVAATPSS